MNDTKVVNFHVVEDKGTTMTMQTQKNLKYDQKYETQWVSKEDYIEAGGLESDWGNVFNNTNKGPLTLLKTVESLTSSWTNVNNQTYALGTTIFKDIQDVFCPQKNVQKMYILYQVEQQRQEYLQHKKHTH